MAEIDYQIIADAVNYYKMAGYKYISVPWIVSAEADEVTKPKNARPFENFMGRFVASGEQSFIQLIMDGKLSPGKYVCVTPCFRDEEPDATHLNSFMKVELIDYIGNQNFFISLISKYGVSILGALAKEMALDASGFISKYLKTDFVFDPETETLDIISAKSGIELGSYGMREYKENFWFYGTGVALPRLSIAVEIEKDV